VCQNPWKENCTSVALLRTRLDFKPQPVRHSANVWPLANKLSCARNSSAGVAQVGIQNRGGVQKRQSKSTFSTNGFCHLSFDFKSVPESGRRHCVWEIWILRKQESRPRPYAVSNVDFVLTTWQTHVLALLRHLQISRCLGWFSEKDFMEDLLRLLLQLITLKLLSSDLPFLLQEHG
jgi:hypothetical protein